MKRWIALLLAFIGLTAYVFYSGYLKDGENKEEGDAPTQDIPEARLGGIVDNPINDTLTIGNIQTDYVKSIKGQLTYEELMKNTEKNLETVLNYPFNPQKGYLFSVGYDFDSSVQFYYQSNQQETRTVIFRVEAGEKKNKVERVYDGTYLKLVAVLPGQPNTLYLYDINNVEHSMAVE